MLASADFPLVLMPVSVAGETLPHFAPPSCSCTRMLFPVSRSGFREAVNQCFESRPAHHHFGVGNSVLP